MELHTTDWSETTKQLVAAALDVIAPARCVGCDRYGNLLCDECARALWEYDSSLACPSCAAPWGELVCTTCGNAPYPWAFVHTLGPLEGVLARAVVLHKDQNERRIGPLFGASLGTAIALSHADWTHGGCTVTWVPPTPAALARRGFDHGHSVAVGVARAMGVSCSTTLEHRGARDSRRLTKAARSANIHGTLRSSGCANGRYILVDDVLTTGATAAECVSALLDSGATEVGLAVLARTW